jgi:short-subunit dehydrogenase
MSSLAAFRGLSTAAAYSASKAALKSYGDALRGRLAPEGIRVSVICPGWVKSPLSDANQYRTPLMISAEAAARIIRRGLEAERSLIAFPWPAYVAARVLATLPSPIYDWIVRNAPRKESRTT